MADGTGRRRNSTGEWSLQTVLYVYLCRALPPHAYVRSVDSGQAAPGYVKIARQARGILPGQADIRVLCDGISADFEVKAAGGQPTDAQIANGAALMRNGGHWFVVRSVADVEAAIRRMGIVPQRTAGVHEALTASARPRGATHKKQRNWSRVPKAPSARAKAAYARSQRP